ncbi:hypothetical protein OAB57_01115 [Bacteriovoracaceae bacterium]|nr:hypothetical protein [Bacteriovoracaceae bacterium]
MKLLFYFWKLTLTTIICLQISSGHVLASSDARTKNVIVNGSKDRSSKDYSRKQGRTDYEESFTNDANEYYDMATLMLIVAAGWTALAIAYYVKNDGGEDSSFCEGDGDECAVSTIQRINFAGSTITEILQSLFYLGDGCMGTGTLIDPRGRRQGLRVFIPMLNVLGSFRSLLALLQGISVYSVVPPVLGLASLGATYNLILREFRLRALTAAEIRMWENLSDKERNYLRETRKSKFRLAVESLFQNKEELEETKINGMDKIDKMKKDSLIGNRTKIAMVAATLAKSGLTSYTFASDVLKAKQNSLWGITAPMAIYALMGASLNYLGGIHTEELASGKYERESKMSSFFLSSINKKIPKRLKGVSTDLIGNGLKAITSSDAAGKIGQTLSTLATPVTYVQSKADSGVKKAYRKMYPPKNLLRSELQMKRIWNMQVPAVLALGAIGGTLASVTNATTGYEFSDEEKIGLGAMFLVSLDVGLRQGNLVRKGTNLLRKTFKGSSSMKTTKLSSKGSSHNTSKLSLNSKGSKTRMVDLAIKGSIANSSGAIVSHRGSKDTSFVDMSIFDRKDSTVIDEIVMEEVINDIESQNPTNL